MALMFYILAAVSVISAVMVVTRPNAVHSALWLVLTFFAVAGLFILQRAEFLAAVQVLVYAGGIMVLFLFVIMLVNIETVEGFVRSRRRIAAAFFVAILMTAAIGATVAMSGGGTSTSIVGGGPPGGSVLPGGEMAGNIEAVGMALLTNYLLAFELVSIVLLVAIIGAIVLCRREV